MHRLRGRRFAKGALAALAFLILAGAGRADVDVSKLPAPTGYVSDLAHVVDDDRKAELETFCTSVEQQLGVQFALVTVDSVGDRPIRDVALDISRKWGVGSKKDNQGVLLLLAVRDRKSDIETGRGIEPYITDGFAGGTLRSMRPELQAGNYGAALLTAAQAMAGQIAQGKQISFQGGTVPPPEEPERRSAPRSRGIPGSLIVLGLFFLIWLFGRGGGRRGGGYRGGGGGGFLTGMILGNLLGGGRGGNGGGWGGGGFGGGNSGGGFGGFGGGDFGGGGASSDW